MGPTPDAPQAVATTLSFGLLILIAGVTAALVLAWRARRWTPQTTRRPRPRHLVTRIVCGTLGAAILIAVAVGTWQEVQRCYAADAAGPFTVHIPTQAAPAPSPSKENLIQADKARLLVHLVIGETSPAGLRPVHAGEIELRWPEDRGRKITRRFEAGDARCEWGVTLHLALVEQVETPRPRRLHPNGTLHLSYRRGTSSGSRMQGFSGIGDGHLGDISGGYPTPHPLSIVAGPAEDLQAFYFVTAVSDDDPLKSVSAEGFLQSRQQELAGLLQESTHRSSGRYRDPFDIPARGLALMEHIGVSGLLLLVAAILLTQLFARRGLAFAGVLAAVVLYVAALERVSLGVHLSRLADPQAPLPSRLTACRQAPGTFFHRGTALRKLREVAADASLPEPLRTQAAEIAAGFGGRTPAEQE